MDYTLIMLHYYPNKKTIFMIRSMKKSCFILFFLLASLNSLFSQDSLVVTGKVVAHKNMPVEDVSVSVEGINRAPVLTDQNGEFTIAVPTGNEWLIIDPIGGYKSKRIFLNNRERLLVSLAEQDMEAGYDDIQLIYEISKRRDIVTSFTAIDLAKVKERNISTIGQVFQGRVPGMFTTNHSGMPGQGAVSFMRGINSVETSNAPLVIIDGIPLEDPGLFQSYIEGNSYHPLTTIDPSDISAITILKDPTATSIYGTKASNGLIIIETLQPQSTQTSINLSMRSGLSLTPDNYIPQLNDVQYKTLANEVLTSSPIKEEYFEEEYPGLYIPEGDDAYYNYIHNTNWQKQIFSNAVSNDIYLSVKGGSDIAKYGLSVGYHDKEGIIKNTSYNRLNVRFVSDLDVFSWLQVKTNASLINNNSYLEESSLSFQTSAIQASLSKPPILSPHQYDKIGQKLSMLSDVDELGTSNPLAVVESFKGVNNNYRFISSIMGSADLSSSLKWNTLLGINFNTLQESVFMPNIGMEEYFSGEAHNVSQKTNNHLFSFYSDNYFNFNKQYNTIHNISASAGIRMHTNAYELDFGEAKNLPANDQYTRLQSGQNNLRRVAGQNAKWNWLSVYNRVNYKYKDKYILNTGISADFSTLTGKEAETAFNLANMPFGLFYSVGAGWRISEETFLSQVKGLENLMLRLSYGIAGNDDIGTYNSLDYYKTTRYKEVSGFVPGGIPNEQLKYETTSQLNTGLDLGLWGGRTHLSVNYYSKLTTDVLMYKPQRSFTGYEYKPENMGSVKNNGWEISVYQRLIDGEKFEWDISSSFSIFNNEVTDVDGEQFTISFAGGEFVIKEGLPINSFYGYKFDGVYSTYEEAEEANLRNSRGIKFGAGDAIYQDLSGPEGQPDGIINDYDKVNLGSPIPDYSGSLLNSFSYNRWSLDLMIHFVYGSKIFNYSRYLNERMVDLSNQSQHVLKRWQYDGDNTTVPRALWNDPIGNSDFSSRWIEDGSYLRLKYITLGYTIPSEFLVFKNAEFFVTVTNLLTLDNYLGYDPEFSYSYNQMEQGIDYGLMPQSRQFMFGIVVGL
jgi:TonB-linked SusC/RagA family outer membrane protein